MFHPYPIACRLTAEQVDWLDSQQQGAIASRSEAIRHAIQMAMEGERRRARRLAAKDRFTP
jgi:Arc/MetJ-type ribon-helix-helix transcriptional regulator